MGHHTGEVLSDIQHWGCLVPRTQRTEELCARVFELLLPDELPAVGAVGGLSQVGGHELVPVHLVHPPSHRPLPLPSEVLEDPVPLQSPCAGGQGQKSTTKHTVIASGFAAAFSLGPQAKGGCGPTWPRGGHGDDARTGAPLLWRQAGRAGTVQPGGEMALERP